jgi:hypothetical protein
MTSDDGRNVTHRGGCHCGAVRFEVDAPRNVEVHDCNCSICAMTGFRHLIVPASRFRLICGREKLTDYRFNTGSAQHLFCSICGIKSFYVPRSNPDGYSVNLRCLESETLGRITAIPFDGQNWESGAAALSHLSED